MVGCGVVSKHRARCMNDVRTYVRTITILRVTKILVWRVVNCRDLDEELHQLRATVGERPGDKSDGLVVQFDNQRTYVRTCVLTYSTVRT